MKEFALGRMTDSATGQASVCVCACVRERERERDREELFQRCSRRQGFSDRREAARTAVQEASRLAGA